MFELGEHIETIRLPYIFENIIPPATGKVVGWGIVSVFMEKMSFMSTLKLF